jgi:hypothetical protein
MTQIAKTMIFFSNKKLSCNNIPSIVFSQRFGELELPVGV